MKCNKEKLHAPRCRFHEEMVAFWVGRIVCGGDNILAERPNDWVTWHTDQRRQLQQQTSNWQHSTALPTQTDCWHFVWFFMMQYLFTLRFYGFTVRVIIEWARMAVGSIKIETDYDLLANSIYIKLAPNGVIIF